MARERATYSNETLHRDIGGLEQRMNTHERMIAEIRTDVKELRTLAIRLQGGWKVLAVIFSTGLAIGLALAKGVMP